MELFMCVFCFQNARTALIPICSCVYQGQGQPCRGEFRVLKGGGISILAIIVRIGSDGMKKVIEHERRRHGDEEEDWPVAERWVVHNEEEL